MLFHLDIFSGFQRHLKKQVTFFEGMIKEKASDIELFQEKLMIEHDNFYYPYIFLDQIRRLNYLAITPLFFKFRPDNEIIWPKLSESGRNFTFEAHLK